jgi:putative PEP-CTERM system TPR-repeat lipoprotein
MMTTTSHLISLRRMIQTAALLSLALFVGCGDGRSASDYLAQAEQDFKAKNYSAAQINLKNALEKEPSNPQARLLLGRAYVEFGAGAAAQGELDKAEKFGIAKEALVIPRLRTWMLQKQYEKVVGLVVDSTLEGTFSAADRAEILAIQGIAHFATGEAENARQSFANALGQDPKCGTALVGQAQMALREGDVENGTRLAKQATEVAPTYAPGWSVLGDIYRHKSDLPAAEEAYGKAIENRGANSQDLLNRALLRISGKNYTGAQEDIARLEKAGFALPHAAYAKGLAFLNNDKPTDARDQFELVVSRFPNYINAVCYLGISLAYAGNIERAAQQMGLCLKAFPNSRFIRRVYASILVRNKQLPEAESTLQPLLVGETAEAEDLELMAQLKLAAKQPDAAVTLLKQVVSKDNQAGHAYLKLGLALVDIGQTADAQKAFEDASKVNPSIKDTDLLVASKLLKSNKPNDAVATLERARAARPNDVKLLNLLAIAHGQLGEKARARALLEEALRIQPTYSLAAVNLAKLLVETNEKQRAIELLSTVVNSEPKNIKALGMLTALDVETNQIERARNRLLAAIQAQGNKPDLALLLLQARFQRNQGEASAAAATLKELMTIEPDNAEILREYGNALLDVGDQEQAITVLRKLSEISSSVGDALLLARVLEGSGDSTGAAKAINKALTLAPDSPAARFAEVKLLIRVRNASLARARLNSLKSMAPIENIPDLLAADGLVKLLENKPTEGINLIRSAFEKDPTYSRMLELARAHSSTNNPSVAIQIVEQWVEKYPKDRSAHHVLASAYITAGNEPKARQTFESLIKEDPTDVLALNNLAWLVRKEHPDQALEYAEKAHKLAPNSVSVLDTLGSLLVGRGENERGLELLKKASSEAPKNVEIQLHLASALHDAGKTREARYALDRIVAAQLDDAQRIEFRALQEKIR